MLRSMTGQGHAQRMGPLGTFHVEIRTVNNRGFKLSPRLGDALGQFEPQVENMVRGSVRRGTVQLNATWKRVSGVGRYQIDAGVVAGYFRQLDELRRQLGADADATIDLSRLTVLPGAVMEASGEIVDAAVVWDELAATLADALANLDQMRIAEGEAMEAQIRSDVAGMAISLDAVLAIAPVVIENYVERLRSKIETFTRREGLTLEPADLLRELHIFADRSDISEEVTRLRSHIGLFHDTIRADDSGGRKLDFLIQEMFRETNTIGSKASDAEIARHVVDMKCALERIRELVQNVE